MSNSTCFAEGATPTKLNSDGSCNLGFLCPYSDADHPPEYCPPKLDCQVTRVQLLWNICDEPQGVYEPLICRPGHYCPPGGKQDIICPAGNYCPLGSYEPWPCDALSYCPEGSGRQHTLLGLLLLIILDLGLLMIILWGPCTRIYHRISGKRRQRLRDPWPNELQELKSSQTSSNAELAAFVESVRRYVGVNELGLSFEFRDVSLTLPKCKSVLLRDINCSIEAGQLWGVMGASGAGKSTFVNVLTGKMKATAGQVLTCGFSSSTVPFKKLIGVVPQDDVVLPEMSVRENLLHSARVRLPRGTPESEVVTHVDLLLHCLGLWEVRDNIVGDVVKPQISGGQRKRVSIGLELAAAPMCLVLDEPTSGLDTTAALSIIHMLRALTRLGITVVCIIHQPRAEIFEAIDQLMLLSRGSQVYVGPTKSAPSYFEGLGYRLPVRCNPADTVIDIVSGHGAQYLVRRGQRGERGGAISPTYADASIESIIQAWRRNSLPETEKNGANSRITVRLSVTATLMTNLLAESSARRGASWFQQFWLCLVRALIQQSRQTLSLVLEIGVAAVAGMLLGLSVYRIQGHLFQGLYLGSFVSLSSATNITLVPQMGLLCSLAIGLAAAAPGVKVFGEEKMIYWREASSGHSRSAYYTGKVVSTFVRMALSSLHFTVFYTLLSTPLISFGMLYAANFLYFFCIYGLAACVSVIARREDGPLLAMIVSLIIGVFGGYGPPLATIKLWHLEWFWRICPGTWFSEAYMDQHTKKLGNLYDLPQAAEWTGYTINQSGLDYSMLLIIGLFYRVLAYFGMILLQRHRQGRGALSLPFMKKNDTRRRVPVMVGDDEFRRISEE